MEKRQSERLYTGTIRTGAAQALQENLQNSKSTKEAESLWEYATTPQLPKFTNDRTPPYISSSIKKDNRQLQPCQDPCLRGALP